MIDLSYLGDDSVFGRIRRTLANRITMLCIEDDPEITALLYGEFFRSTVFNKKIADSFTKALNIVVSKEPYHCWILDLSLNRHNDGLELLKKKPEFPYCVVASGSISLYDATVAMREGAFGAYDKNTIVVSNTHEFIREVCSLATLSFLLHARKPERFDMFTLLIRNFIRSPEEWSRFFCRNERSVRNICEEYSGLTARQFLFLFHALNAIVFSDCLVKGMAGYTEAAAELDGRRAFHENCAGYVAERFEMVYGRKLL